MVRPSLCGKVELMRWAVEGGMRLDAKAQLGSREWKLPRLPVPVSAALEEMWTAIPDSLLRTGLQEGFEALFN